MVGERIHILPLMGGGGAGPQVGDIIAVIAELLLAFTLFCLLYCLFFRGRVTEKFSLGSGQ